MSGAQTPLKKPRTPSAMYVLLAQSRYPLKWLCVCILTLIVSSGYPTNVDASDAPYASIPERNGCSCSGNICTACFGSKWLAIAGIGWSFLCTLPDICRLLVERGAICLTIMRAFCWLGFHPMEMRSWHKIADLNELFLVGYKLEITIHVRQRYWCSTFIRSSFRIAGNDLSRNYPLLMRCWYRSLRTRNYWDTILNLFKTLDTWTKWDCF